MIDPKLVTLLTVNELNSFTKAAQRLSLTQPAASQHVRQLEKELGVTIFVRGEGNLKLTSEGEIVIKYAKRIVSLYQNLQQSLKDERRHARKITVGITHTSESNFMVEVLAKYSSFSEGTRITIISDAINNLYLKLKTYEIDLAIVEGRITDPNFILSYTYPETLDLQGFLPFSKFCLRPFYALFSYQAGVACSNWRTAFTKESSVT